MSFNFTPLDQAYQLHHVSPNTYSSLYTAKYSPHCMFCGSHNSVPLMEKQDRGAFRQCANPSCRKQFQATILSQPVANYQLSSQNPQNKTTYLQSQPIQPTQQIQTQELREPAFEPQFISKFKTNF